MKYDADPGRLGGSAPKPPEFSASGQEQEGTGTRKTITQPKEASIGGMDASALGPGGRSGRTPAAPYPSAGREKDRRGSARQRVDEWLGRGDGMMMG